MSGHEAGPSSRQGAPPSSAGARGGRLRIERSPTADQRPSPPRRRGATPEGPRGYHRGGTGYSHHYAQQQQQHQQHQQHHANHHQRGSNYAHGQGGAPSWRNHHAPSASAHHPGPSSRGFNRHPDRGAPSGPRHGSNRPYSSSRGGGGASSYSASYGTVPDWRGDADRARARRDVVTSHRDRDWDRERGRGETPRSSARRSASPSRTYASDDLDDDLDEDDDHRMDGERSRGVKRRRDRGSSRSRSPSRDRGRHRSSSMTPPPPPRSRARSRSRSRSTGPSRPRSPRSPRSVASIYSSRRSRSPIRDTPSIPSGPRDWRRHNSYRDREWDRERRSGRGSERGGGRRSERSRERSSDNASRPSSRPRDREVDRDDAHRHDRRRLPSLERKAPRTPPPPPPQHASREDNTGSAGTSAGRRWTDEEWEAERARRKAKEAAGEEATSSTTRRRTGGWDRGPDNDASGTTSYDPVDDLRRRSASRRGGTAPDPRSSKSGLAGRLGAVASAASSSTSSPLDVLNRPSRTARLEAAPLSSQDMLSYGSGSSDSGEDDKATKDEGRPPVKRPSTPPPLDKTAEPASTRQQQQQPRVLARRGSSGAKVSIGTSTRSSPPQQEETKAIVAAAASTTTEAQQPRKQGWHVVRPGSTSAEEKDKGSASEPAPSAAMQAAMEAAMAASAPQPIVASPGPPSPKPEEEEQEEPLSLTSLPPRAGPGEAYDRISQVGEGTYGQVFKARARDSRVLVALKKIRMESEKDGFPVTAMREIKLLQSLRHPNVVRLLEMMVSKGSAYMVFEYLEHDLNGLLSHPDLHFTPAHLKSLAHQLLSSLDYLHHKSVLHRDLKGSNVLLSNAGVLKLADFGLARFYMKRRSGDYTNRVVTLWYRPPELLLGATQYGPEVDMWGAGCIFLELFTRKPVFQGHDEIDQVSVLVDALGPISTRTWPRVAELPWFELVQPDEEAHGDDDAEGDAKMDDAEQHAEEGGGAAVSGNARELSPGHYSRRFREPLQELMTPAALDVAEALLLYDPSQRSSASRALSMPYFTSELPRPQRPAGLLGALEGEWHEYESRRARKVRAAAAQQQRQAGDAAKVAKGPSLQHGPTSSRDEQGKEVSGPRTGDMGPPPPTTG